MSSTPWAAAMQHRLLVSGAGGGLPKRRGELVLQLTAAPLQDLFALLAMQPQAGGPGAGALRSSVAGVALGGVQRGRGAAW